MNKIILLLLLSLFQSLKLSGQNDSLKIKKRLVPLLVSTGVVYGAGIYGMNELWYKHNPRTSFHFFNDIHEWEQVDKAGHCYTAFFESMYAVKALQWAGLTHKKAVFWGSMAGIFLQTPIELLDGFSSAYGASLSDVAANTLGSALVFTQYQLYNEIRIQPKFSFHETRFSSIRPSVLGASSLEHLLKDYNGQTYWLTFNIRSFLNKTSRFPRWLNLSTGYGAENMVYAVPAVNRLAGFIPYRQYYLSIDIDFTRIKTKSQVLKILFACFNLLHVPAPAIELNKNGLKLHALYF